MTINELLKLPIIGETYDIGPLIGCYYNHIKEIKYGDEELPSYVFQDPNCFNLEENDRVKVSFLANDQFDTRRIWVLAVVYYETDPVMVIQNAGREGDDYSKRFIIEEYKSSYLLMLDYINSLRMPPKNDDINKDDIYSIDKDLGDQLTSFYNDTLYINKEDNDNE